MTDTPMRIVVLSAGLSSPSSTRMLADHLAASAREELEARGAEVAVTAYELRSYAHEITDAMLSHFPGERLAALIAAVREADAVIAVTPIFNTGPSGLFKSFIDVVPLGVWPGKPVLLGATAGTARHSLALEYTIRPMFVYLKAALVPTAVVAASSDFGAAAIGEGDEASLASRAHRAAQELAALGCGSRRIGHGDVEPPSESDGPADERPTNEDADGPTAPGASAPEASRSDADLDPEFSDFVPMGSLLRRD